MLRLCFWDICKPVRNNDARTKSRMFRKEQAEEVLRFVHNHWEQIDQLLVHCEAGISRSPAIAAAISHIKLGPESDTAYFTAYKPNLLVYRMLLETHYASESIANYFMASRSNIQFMSDK